MVERKHQIFTYCPQERRLGRANRSPCEWGIHLSGSGGREERSRLAFCYCLRPGYKVCIQRSTKGFLPLIHTCRRKKHGCHRKFIIITTFHLKICSCAPWLQLLHPKFKPPVFCSQFCFMTHLIPAMSSQSFSQPSDDDDSWMSIVTIVMEIRYPGNGAW